MLAVNLDLRNKTVLLAGGGAVGRRKLGEILRAGACVRVIEPGPDDFLRELAEKNEISLYAEFQPSLLAGVSLAFVATSDSAANRRIAREARRRGIWVNAAENPPDGDFFLPAMVEHGDFRLTVSTGGHSPALAARVAEQLRHSYGPEYGRFLALMARLRPLILASALPPDERRAVFRTLAESESLFKLLATPEPDPAPLLNCLKSLAPFDFVDAALLEGIFNDAAHCGQP